jgi:hypothetical protein
MELVSRIEKRKELLGNNSILTNPYKLWFQIGKLKIIK